MNSSRPRRHASLRQAACAAVARKLSLPLVEEFEPRRLFAAISELPILHSNPGATAKLFLDMDGNPAINDWLGIPVTATGPYDTDGDKTTYSSGELADINEIWARVAEAYSPFNIDVTTQDPGNRADRVTAQVLIGGSDDDWYQGNAGGVAPLGAFYNGAPNIGFVFSDDAFGDTRYIGMAASHEAGHMFGLFHHSVFDGDTLVEEYDPGNPQFGPIMGFPISSQRALWANTVSDINSDPVLQDDLAQLSGPQNGFGYRADDYGNTRFSGFEVKTDTLGQAQFKGIIGRSNDVDAFNIESGTGTIHVDVTNAQFAPMLDVSVSIVDPFGTIVGSAVTSNLDESLDFQIDAGNYTILVSGAGNYGDLGQYTLDIDVPAGASASDHFLIESSDFDDNIKITFADDAYTVDINGDIQTIDANTIKQFDILTGGGNDVVTLGPGVCKTYMLGGSGDDTLMGGDFNDTITGSGGNDQIFGGGGDDRLTGSAGSDILVGGNGRDREYGEEGNDVMTGGSSVDRMWGGPGNDVLSGESGADKAYGEDGNDTVYGGNGTDLLNGGAGLDQLWGGGDNDTLYSRDLEFDQVNGGAGDDSAQTEDGDLQESLENLLA
jgi:Ca2+-binding RTX toxin-like protein